MQEDKERERKREEEEELKRLKPKERGKEKEERSLSPKKMVIVQLNLPLATNMTKTISPNMSPKQSNIIQQPAQVISPQYERYYFKL